MIWNFCGDRIPKQYLGSLRKLAKQLQAPEGRLSELLDLLEPGEAAALLRRVEWVLSEKVYPGSPMRSRRRG